jgi:cell shape-determining protein MreD
MKRALGLTAMTLAAIFISTRYRPLGLGLNLTALAAYAVGMRFGHYPGMLYGAAMGFVSDGLSIDIIGPGIAGKATAGYVASYVNRGLFTWAPVFGFFAASAVTMLDGFISYGALWAFTNKVPDAAYAIVSISAQAAINGAAGYFIPPADER